MSGKHSTFGHRSGQPHRWLRASLAACALAMLSSPTRAGDDLALGKALFAREWLPNDPRSSGGDGLGPVYNETSCLACHNQGGPGGSGPASTNVEILSSGTNLDPGALHPGLTKARSVVLHRFGVDPEYRRWRLRLLGDEKIADMAESPQTEIQQVQRTVESLRLKITWRGTFFVSGGMSLSRRNPPALFGAGLIDAIPDEVLLAAAERKDPGVQDTPHLGLLRRLFGLGERKDPAPSKSGRVHRLKDGKIGRFGWKAQVPTLNEFVLTACANELGLEVPGHKQAESPLN
ncbi:MAG TPA: hypothetical protein VGZ22_10905, partial [Isosphaeraceae bacterium]|nr:hypothetical protein [Isosphaeraceae bacterium]